MSKVYKLQIENDSPLKSINSFFAKLLSEKVVDSLLVPQEAPTGKTVIQTLVSAEEQVTDANPFAPLLLTNSATMIASLTVDKPKEKIGVVLRSCEIRAMIELAKIRQVNLDNLVIIGMDCLGTYELQTYQKIREKNVDTKTLTEAFLSKTAEAQANLLEGEELREACQGCKYPNPQNTDIAIRFLGCDVKKEIFIHISEENEQMKPEALGLVVQDDVSKWEKASESCREARTKVSDKIIEEVSAQIKDIKGLLEKLEGCRRCYNCRKECPICYCRECIFDSNTFEHTSLQYLNWAQKRGKIRMPTDTLLFHLTRLNHMVVSCVACGQCTSACPNNIPVAKIFKTIGSKVQKVFDYQPGKDIEEEIPQATFKEDEFKEVGETS